jgi:putative DNA primase/helicase
MGEQYQGENNIQEPAGTAGGQASAVGLRPPTAAAVYSSPLEAALAYAARGWPVFPCHSVVSDAYGTRCTCSKSIRVVCEKDAPAKHPRVLRGLNDASTEADQIRAWWTSWPTSNPAILTGPKSALLVLDVDPRNGGLETLAALEVKHGALPASLRVRTGGGGLHIFFAHPGFKVTSKSNALGPGLDVKGDGGYVVGPPSKHISGNCYEWMEAASPGLAPLPGWLLAALRAPSQVASCTSSDTLITERRHEHLVQLDARMRKGGASEETRLAALHAERDTHLAKDGREITDTELRKIVEWSSKAVSVAPLAGAVADVDYSDAGNAMVLALTHGADLRFVPGLGWLVYEGGRWKQDPTREVMRRARTVANHWFAEGAKYYQLASQGGADSKGQAEKAEAITNWAKKCRSSARLEAMVSLAESEASLVERIDALDRHPMLLCTPSGTVDLRTGSFRPNDRADLITRITGVPCAPEATAPVFDRFLSQILPDPELRAFLLRWAGYALTGEIAEHHLVVLYGTGANGKSTLIEAFRHVLGDYFVAANPELLLARDHATHPTERMTLMGRRMVVCSETDQGSSFSEAKLKLLTGGNTINARLMGKDEVTFQPTHKLAMETNHRPRVRGTDEGVWRRLLLVPFEVTIPEAERDPELPKKLRAEASGILNKLIAGCLEWQRIGIAPPAAVKAATNAYREEEDTLGQFLADTCVQAPTARIAAGDLFRAYTAWCEKNGEYQLSQRGLGLRLAERGFVAGKSGGERCWRGLGTLEGTHGTLEYDFPGRSRVREKTIGRDREIASQASHASLDEPLPEAQSPEGVKL